MTAENKVVLFIDVLGFAALTESNSIDVNILKKMDMMLSHSALADVIMSPPNSLVRIFSGFHRTLQGELSIARMRHPLYAIAFSDSAFIATQYAYEATRIATNLIHSLLSQKIPVRIGIAYGSFTALRFKSDITPDGGDHAAHFLGTAVVRAHAAETCGIKGCRILLHPSLIPLLTDLDHNPVDISYIECSEMEQNNKVKLLHEINYWDLLLTKEIQVWRGLQDMWDDAPSSEIQHYEATASAINRMRIAKGYPSLKKLRRRTLPK